MLIGRKKNIDPGTYWVMGIVLGLISVVILLFMKPGLPKAPAGMRAVKCARCNTVQNVILGQGRVDLCFRCEAALPQPLQKPVAPPVKP